MVRGVSWNLAGTASTQGATFLVNIILANLWGLRTFGEYAIVQSTVATVVYVTQLGTAYTAIRQLAESRTADPEQAGRLLGLCAVVAGVMATLAAVGLFAAAPWIASRALGGPGLSGPLMVGALVLAPAIMNGFMNAAMAGLEGYPALGKIGIVVGVVYVWACLGGAWLGGLSGAIAGVALSALLQSIILARALVAEASRQQLTFRFRDIWQETSLLVQYAIPASLSGGIALPAIWLSNAFLVRQPGGYDQMALFAAANSFRVASQFVPSMVNNVGVSVLSNQLGADDRPRYHRVYWANLGTVGSIVGLGTIVLAIFGRMALGLFGEGFDRGYAVLVILMIAAFLETLCTATAQPLQRRERVWTMFFGVILPCHCVLVLAAWLLAPAYGAFGVASAYVAGWSLALVASAYLVFRLGIWKTNV